jgi:hypothetical protein
MTELSQRIIEDWKERQRVAEACLSIYSFLEKADFDKVQELSFFEIQKIASSESEIGDEDIALAVQYLTGAGIGILGIRCYFYDGEQEYLLPDEEYLEAIEKGRIAHPVTGTEIKNINSYLFPWFTPGRIFNHKTNN